jgi:hypothetical protein
VANGKMATAAVTQCGYGRGGFFEGYESRREDRGGSDGSAFADARQPLARNTANPMIGCRLQYAYKSSTVQSVEVVRNHEGGARLLVAPGDRRVATLGVSQPCSMMSMEGRTDESQERRLVIQPGEFGASKKRQGHEGADVG